MKILIIGAGVFLGKKLTESLGTHGNIIVENQQKEISKIILNDIYNFTPPIIDTPIEIKIGSYNTMEFINYIKQEKPEIIVHLAAVLSGQAEKEFEVGIDGNLYAPLQLLETLRSLEYNPIFITTSSLAVFGGELPNPVPDNHQVMPQSSYGTQKAILELLVNDYSRRGYINGRVLRLPTVVVRPGKPNSATSSFVSSIIREPLQGDTAICPVENNFTLWICSPKIAIENIIYSISISHLLLPTTRVLNIPGITVSIGEMLNILTKFGGESALQKVQYQPDDFISRVVSSWPRTIDTVTATKIGFKKDMSFEDIVKYFIDNDISS